MDYWEETIETAAEECGISLTEEQLKCLASAVEASHDNYGLAYYQPPSSDRVAAIEREASERRTRLERKVEVERKRTLDALKTALRLRPEARISVDDDGSVLLHDGRTTVIQF